MKTNRRTKLDALAAAAHMVNRVYCQSLGDDSQVPWSEAPSWQRNSAVQGVLGALSGNTPAQSHEAWLRQKESEGWVYGEVKDAEKKTHPCMVPYGDLPDDQKRKDEVFLETVREMARILGVEA